MCRNVGEADAVECNVVNGGGNGGGGGEQGERRRQQRRARERYERRAGGSMDQRLLQKSSKNVDRTFLCESWIKDGQGDGLLSRTDGR